MSNIIRLADELVLPVDVVTQTTLIVGKRGSGKSNTAARLVEQLHAAKIPFVVLDPTDTWWGLKAGRDGGPGLDGVYVFGGRHADVPLEPKGGKLIAEVLCDYRTPMVLSVKHLSGRARSDFMVDFAQTLFQKWQGGPLHVVLEEAHELAPQNAINKGEGEPQMLGAFKRLWKLGRSQGIGGSAVTQRPASLSKDITTQSEILIAHRTIGPQDVAAIGEWIKYHGQAKDILAELPSLPSGEAFVWAPEFPESMPIGLHRAKIFRRETYDSASTPKVGETRVEPKELAPVDMERLAAKMAATIERQKAEDPKELQKRVQALEAELRRTASMPVAEDPKHAANEFARGYGEGYAAGAAWVRGDLQPRCDTLLKWAQQADREQHDAAQTTTRVREEIEDLRAKIAALPPHDALVVPKATGEGYVAWKVPAPAGLGRFGDREPVEYVESGRRGGKTDYAKRMAPSTDGNINGGERKILAAVGELHTLGVNEPTLEQIAIFAGYDLRGGRPAGYLRRLFQDDYLAASGGGFQWTRKTHEVVEAPSGIPTLHELHRRALDRLEGGERKILEFLISVYPHALTRDDVGQNVGYDLKGGRPAGYVRKLVTLNFAESKGNTLRASQLLFPKGMK